VHITLRTERNELKVGIRDDGRGFDLNAAKLSGNGLHNMRQRIETLGGSYHLSSASRKGTEVEITIPLSAEHRRIHSASSGSHTLKT